MGEIKLIPGKLKLSRAAYLELLAAPMTAGVAISSRVSAPYLPHRSSQHSDRGKNSRIAATYGGHRFLRMTLLAR
ncbi:MAG: hypothetical protein ACXW6T_06635 [Candidatus Binatia bacterium]